MNRYIRVSKSVTASILRRLPVLKHYYRFRKQIDVTCEAAALLEQASARGTLNSSSLSRRLRWLGMDFGGLPNAFGGDVLLIASGQRPSQGQVRALEDQLEAASYTALPCQQWLRLNELFCFRGRYPLAQICREHARQLAVLPFMQPDVRPPISWTNSIAAALEGGECADPRALDLILKKANIKEHEAAKWHLLLSVLNAEQVPESDLAVFDKTGYLEFVKSKNIVIVGPSPTEAQDAAEIDSSDVVIRLNHSFSGKGTDSVHKGLRTDVTYFNGEQAIAFTKERNGIMPSEISWACCKGQGRALEVQARNPDKYCRSLVSFDGMTFHGSYNMVPLVVMDLVAIARQSIKIFHTDLMLTISRAKGYYPQSFQRHGKEQYAFLRGSISHDPVLQYRTLRRLWETKKIHGDKAFEEVMMMGLDNYLRKLERVYAVNVGS